MKIELPTREEVLSQASLRFVCRNEKCQKSWQTLLGVNFTEARCPHCFANIEGKVFPRKRETPREEKVIELTENIELQEHIQAVLAENIKSVEDYRAGKKQAIGFLVGQTLKKIKANPAEVKLRIEQLL